MEHRIRTVFEVFLTFLKIGAFTFGGGYAMIPLIQREVVEKKKWITDDDILEIVAIAESTPGPIAINAATFVGYRTCGFLGSLAATLGVVTPSFAIILALSSILDLFYDVPAVRYAFTGIRAGVLALILKALVSMYRKTHKNPLSYVLMAIAFISVAFLKIDAIWVIVACAVVGLTAALLAGRREKKQ